MTSIRKLAAQTISAISGDDALDGEEVASDEVLGELVAEALPLERRLGEDRAAQQQGDLQAHDGDDRHERVAERVLVHHPPLGHAAGAGRRHVVHAQRLQQVDADEAEEDAAGEQAERDRRQHRVLQHVDDDAGVAPQDGVDDHDVASAGGRPASASSVLSRGAARRRPAERRERELEQQADEEDRRGVDEDREEAQQRRRGTGRGSGRRSGRAGCRRRRPRAAPRTTSSRVAAPFVDEDLADRAVVGQRACRSRRGAGRSMYSQYWVRIGRSSPASALRSAICSGAEPPAQGGRRSGRR